MSFCLVIPEPLSINAHLPQKFNLYTISPTCQVQHSFFLNLVAEFIKTVCLQRFPFFIDMERLTRLVSLIFRRQPVKLNGFLMQLSLPSLLQQAISN